MASDRIRIGGLWKQTSKTGLNYLSGKLGQARLLIFQNDSKRDENSPDHTMYLVPDERQSEGIEGRSEPGAAPSTPN